MAIPSNIVPFVKPQRRDGADDVQGPIEEARGRREGSGAKPASRVWIIVLLILLFGGFALIFGGEWGPSTGAAGLAMQACQGVGLITFGISLAMTARLLHLQHRTKTTGPPPRRTSGLATRCAANTSKSSSCLHPPSPRTQAARCSI